MVDVGFWRSCIPHWKLAGYRLACGHRVWVNSQFQATADDWLYCGLSRLWLRARCEVPSPGAWGTLGGPMLPPERRITERRAA